MAAMQPAAQLQFQNLMSPSRPCLPQPTPIHQEKVAKLRPQIQNDSYPPKELTVLASQEVPRLRAVVESQAFRNILVDEMDMMVSRAATVIQANWKGYRLRQKLISQMTAAKAIQEAWRRFSTRRLMHSNKLTAKKAKREDDGDIPYHQPQQVRFHAPEDQSPLMVTKETQFPSSDNLVSSQATAGPCASRVPRGGLDRHTGPKHQPCMLTKTFQSSCLMRHLEGDSVKIRHVASKTIKVGTLEPAATGRYGQAIHGSLKTQTQTHTETDVPKVPLHIYQINKVPTKVCPAAAAAPKSPATMSTAPKSAPQTRPSSPATVTTVTTVTKMPAPTSPTSPMIRPLVPVPPNSSLSSTTPQMQVRSMVPGVRAQPPVSAVSPTIKALPRLGTFVTKAPLQTGPGFAVTKNLIQTRPVTRSQAQTCAVSTPSKTCQSSPTVKPSPQTRLAAMITKTPAQLRSVAAVFRTLCGGSTEAAVPSSPKSSSQSPVIAGNTASQVHLTNPKAKVTVSTKQTPAVVKVASQSYLAEGKGRCGPQGNLDIIPKPPPAKSPLEVEKMKPCPARASKKEAALKTNTTIATRALSWTKVMEDRSKALTQIEQRAEIVKVHFRVYMPEEITVTLSQAQLAVPLTKTCPQTRPSPCHARTLLASPCCKALSQSCTPSRLAPGTPEGRRPPVGLSASLSSSPLAAHLMSLTAQLQPAGEQARSVSRDHPTTSRPTSACPQSRSSGMTSVPPEVYPHTYSHISAPQHPMASILTKNSSQLRPPAEHVKTMNAKTAKAACQVCPSAKLNKAPSLAQLITCLAKVPSQAQIATETAKCLLTAHPPTDLSSKTQSQTFLSTSKASVQLWQHLGTLSTGPRAKPDDRSVAQPQPHSHAPNKTVQNSRSVATDPQGMLVPLMTPSGHPVCNAESWGDSGRPRTPPPSPMPNQAVSCHEDLAASIASLCADLVAMLGSPEDLRALLVKTLSQGEVRTALSQALSREVLGPSVVKAMPQGMLGMALMKALSWGELGISLSRALSRGELRPELSKATQGKLAEVLCKALTEDERATLSQALCQGELGAVFTQSLAQMAQRTGAFLPKASSKTVGSRMTTAPAPMEVTCSGSLSVAWGPTMGPVGARCSKVRPPWEGLPWEQPDGIPWDKSVGITLEGSPCSPQSLIGSFSGGTVTSTYCCPLLKMPTLSREVGSVLYSGLYLRSLDLDSMACGEGPHVPKRPSQPPPPGLWQPLVANGVGPSSNQPSVTSNSPVPSSHQPSVASRVPYPGSSYREGNVVASKPSGRMGDGNSPTSLWPSTTCQSNVCQCPTQGIHKKSPCSYCSSLIRSHSSLPKETCKQILLSGHNRVLSPPGSKEMATIVRNVADEQGSDQPSPVLLNPKSQTASNRSTPKLEKRPQVPLTPPFHAQTTGQHKSLLDELLAKIPQHPQIVLAKSYPRTHCQDSCDSQSSLKSSPSDKPSVPSSLPPSGVLECSKEGDMQDSQPMANEIREARYRLQGQLERTCPPSLQHTLPKSQRPPLGLGPFLSSSSLASNVHWDSDSASDYSTGDLTEALCQNTATPWHKKDQVRARDRKPSGVTCLDPVLPKDTRTQRGAPSPGQARKASEGSQRLSQPLEAKGLSPSSPHPAGSKSVSPGLAQSSPGRGVTLSLAQPSPGRGVTPRLAQPSTGPGVASSLAQPSTGPGVAPSLAQPSPGCGVTPRLAQPSTGPGVASSLAQPSTSPGVAPSLAHPSVATRVSPALAQPSIDTGLFPGLTEPLIYYGSPTNFSQPFVYAGGSPIYTQKHVASSAPSNFTQTSATGVVTLNSQSVSIGATSGQAQPSAAIHGAPRPTQSPLSSWPPPGGSSMPTQVAGHPDSVQTSVAPGMFPGFFQPFPAYSVPSHFTQPYMATVVTPNYVQPCVSHGMSPGLAQAFVVSVRSPTLAHVSVANRASPNHSQPTTASTVVPGVLKVPLSNRVPPNLNSPFLAPRMYPDLSNAPAATLGTLSLLPPTVVCGVGRGVSKPAFSPQQHTLLDSSTTQSQPSMPNQGGLQPCVKSTPGQPSLGICSSSGGNLPQGSTVHSEPTQANKGPPSPMVQTMHGHPSVAPVEDNGLAIGTSVPCQALFRGIAPGIPQGPLTTGLFLSVCQGANPPPMAAWASPADIHWTQNQAAMAAGVGQSPCPATVPTMQVPPELFPNQLATSIPQPCATLPIALDPQLFSMATMVPPSYQYVGMIIADAAGAVGGTLPQASVDGKVSSAPAPKPVFESKTPNLPQVSMTRGVGRSVPAEFMADGVTQKVPPESMVDGLVQSVPPESKAEGVAQNVSPESTVGIRTQNLLTKSVISGEGQSSHGDAGASDVALGQPPCPVASNKAPSHPQKIDGSREKLSPAIEPSPNSHCPSPWSSFVASRPSNLVPGGSMLVGICPRPFQVTQYKEASQVSFLTPSVTKLANDCTPATQKLAEDPQHPPSQISQDPGQTKLVGVGDLTLPKPGQMAKTTSSTVTPSTDSVKPEGIQTESKLGASQTGLGATGRERRGHIPLAAENVPKDQTFSKTLSNKEVPKQVQSLGKHPTVSSNTVQPLASESKSDLPSLHSGPRIPSRQETPVDNSSQPLAYNVSVAPQLSTGRAGTAELPLGLEGAKPGNPRAVQSSEGTNSAPPPKIGASSASQIGEPQSHTKRDHQESLTARKFYQSSQGNFVSELLEGSMDRLLPFSYPLKPVSRASSDSHREPSGASTVGVMPIIHVGVVRGQKTSSGGRRVSLVHEPSSDDPQRPLLDESAKDARQAGQPRTVLSLTTHLDQRPPSARGPRVSYDKGSLVPTMSHGQNIESINSSVTGYDGRSQMMGGVAAPPSQKHEEVRVPKTSFDEGSRKVTTTHYGHRLHHITVRKTTLDGSSQGPRTMPLNHRPHLVTYPKTGHNTMSPPPTVPQGPVDAGLAAGQSWNSKVPNVSVRATAHAGAPPGIWPSRGHKPWDPSGAEAALDRKPSAELLMSVQAMEKVVVQAVVTIQACTRGYLVRRTVKVWHQWATIIQATWRGYRVRRNLERLFRATTIIQAAWRGYSIRRARTRHILLPTAWPEHGGRTQGNLDSRSSSEHRCFLSCQPDVCSVCQSLGPPVESPPSVVMLVGSQPRTCHVCGHTLSTRVVQGFGQGASVHSVSRWTSASQQSTLSQQHRACTIIQAAWKGYRTRRQLRQQQSAAKMVQAMWRGHYTRSCLTTDALLGTGGPWSISRDISRRTSRAYSLHWPGV
ncbi:IQ domain-containing protein N isoform X1 [Rattus norvegicus]|nr:IQ domain-containing protein N isoform X1 [Rattus norvegicus]XP_006253035.2 IQ domain-containing protein N isoform X1 [Rattus norvegicus]XP_006253036.2 IQ domain-containing protein N isoform X1 [Rattus norvegicus]